MSMNHKIFKYSPEENSFKLYKEKMFQHFYKKNVKYKICNRKFLWKDFLKKKNIYKSNNILFFKKLL